jgi:hypothetical protein
MAASAKSTKRKSRVTSSQRRSRGVTFDELRALALRMPGAEAGTCYGTPALRVKGRIWLRLREDAESVALKISLDQRDALLQAEPKIFFVTDHYLGYPMILLRLAEIGIRELADLLEHSWRFVAPKRLLAAFEAGASPEAKAAPPKRARKSSRAGRVVA